MIDILDFQWISLIVFVILLTAFVVYKRKKIEIQKMLFPIIYAGLYRTNFGLNFINKVSSKYKEWVKLFGYCGIGVGFLGMVLIVVSILQAVFTAITQPSAPAGVVPVLPQMNIPGIGFLPFWYWILAIFIIVVIHEFSHGIVAKAHGIKIKSSGIGFFSVILPVIPIAFVEPEEKEMEKKEDHVQYSIFAAGPFSNIITAVIILLVFMFVFTPIDRAMTENAGFSFTKMNESYPAYALPDGIVITRFNGESVNAVQNFTAKMQCVKAGEVIRIGNESDEFNITTISAPESDRAFIGITEITNVFKLKDNVNRFWYNVYVWFRGLFKWIGLLSFFIGLANLLPIGPIDGGRMMKTLADKTVKNKEKAKKRWVAISLILVFLLLLSMIYPYLRSLF